MAQRLQKFREIVFQLLYSRCFEGSNGELSLVMRLHAIPKKRAQEAEKFVDAIWEKREELDQLIADKAIDYDLDRITRIERSILLLGLYELLYTDLPDKVAMAEAVRLTRKFSTAEGGAFVNGLLDAVYRSCFKNWIWADVKAPGSFHISPNPIFESRSVYTVIRGNEGMKPFQKNKSLAEFSTFGIGGKAHFFTEVETIEDLQEVLQHCYWHKLPFHILGKGSNSLFHDEGFAGLVILNKIQFCEITDTEVYVGAGFSFSLLGLKTARKGLSGLEFAGGIPASVGGAIFMNAGAGGAETSDVLQEVIFIDERGEKNIFTRKDLVFSYRYSSFHEMRGAIAAARFVLTPSKTAHQKQLDIIAYRTKTQPYNELSCGCVFRNPKGESAGALIEKCGLKNAQIGGAKVSDLHANFIINASHASAMEVLALAKYVKKSVQEQTGIELEMELRIIPKKYE